MIIVSITDFNIPFQDLECLKPVSISLLSLAFPEFLLIKLFYQSLSTFFSFFFSGEYFIY
ncbi:hypothetical protein CW304_11300 [Bacillus sp. UFRGS-B20]|nr:hypothetical protein CW304_11300 [Bacillus sp. UFRGS-B20]